MNPHTEAMSAQVHSAMMAASTYPGERYDYSQERTGYSPPLHTALAPTDRDREPIIPIGQSPDFRMPAPSKHGKKYASRAAARDR